LTDILSTVVLLSNLEIYPMNKKNDRKDVMNPVTLCG